jgi:hypothetical protein
VNSAPKEPLTIVSRGPTWALIVDPKTGATRIEQDPVELRRLHQAEMQMFDFPVGRDGAAGAIRRANVANSYEAGALVTTRRGRVHIVDSTEIRGHNVVVSIMLCGDVLSPEILSSADRSTIHPFDWCRRCTKRKEQHA